MKSIMGNLLWEIPYIETHTMNKIPAKALTMYKMYVEELKYLGHVKKMVDLYWEEQCLIHADCHWMSVFIKDGKAAVRIFIFILYCFNTWVYSLGTVGLPSAPTLIIYIT